MASKHNFRAKTINDAMLGELVNLANRVGEFYSIKLKDTLNQGKSPPSSPPGGPPACALKTAPGACDAPPRKHCSWPAPRSGLGVSIITTASHGPRAPKTPECRP